MGRYLTAVAPGPEAARRGRRRPRNHGLRNIAERAAELGGEVTLRRRRGGGLRISVRVPVQAAGTTIPGAVL
jgi:nitrate/nitrite-specific signal transduction histidine kinase